MYQISEKGRGIREMFDAIAPRYDLLNRLLSFGVDRRWRKTAVGLLTLPVDGMVLDVATGTGDVALEIARPESPRSAYCCRSPAIVTSESAKSAA
jgi:demethylmenaquinone methyltransferase/2-methoxy-6-polyprenyl-1,4-benzoquinol methylase